MDKAGLRARIRASRRTRSAGARAIAGPALAAGVMALPEVAEGIAAGRPLAAYLSMATEPSTVALLSTARRTGAVVIVPRVSGSDLSWVRVEEGTMLRLSERGMDDPVGPAIGFGASAVAECAAIVLPALAVDASGRRLGQGGGYYDRVLAALPAGERPLLVALLFDDELVVEVPVEPHDLAVDVVITPKRTLRIGADASAHQ